MMIIGSTTCSFQTVYLTDFTSCIKQSGDVN